MYMVRGGDPRGLVFASVVHHITDRITRRIGRNEDTTHIARDDHPVSTTGVGGVDDIRVIQYR